jgi:two-component system response regulator LytT
MAWTCSGRSMYHRLSEAFEHKVVDYLVKPITLPRFIKSIERVREIFDGSFLQAKQNDSFFVRHNGSWVKIIFDQILYIKALGDYAMIYTDTDKYTIHITMKSIDEQLPKHMFQRVHRSYIVAISKILQFTDNMVTIKNEHIPVAESFRIQLLEKLNLLN